MELLAAIHGRRAARDYTSEAVDEATIRQLIDAAAWAPSAMNEQPWGFVVVRDRDVLDRISREAKAYMLATMTEHAHSGHFRTALGDPAFQIFHDAPVLILICAVARGPWIVEDCALAAENLMLAAHARALGTCWIGFAQSLLATAGGRALLNLPGGWVPLAPIIVGHPASTPPPVPRREPLIRLVG